MEGYLKIAEEQHADAMRQWDEVGNVIDKYWLDVNLGRIERNLELENEHEADSNATDAFTHHTAYSQSKIRNFINDAQKVFNEINDDPFIDLVELQLYRNKVYEMTVASKNVIGQQDFIITNGVGYEGD